MKLTHTQTQSRQIVAAMLKGEGFTSLDALNRFGCLSFSRRICDIEAKGYVVSREWVETPSGKRVKRYWIASKYQPTNILYNGQ